MPYACVLLTVSDMAEILLTDLRENMRAVLSDRGTNGVYQWKDEVLDGALRSVVQTGMGPADVAVNDSLDGLNPAPVSPDARGYLVLQAALMLMGGGLPFSYKTRGMSVSIRDRERQTTIEHLRRLLGKIEGDGDPHGTGIGSVFGVWQDFENAVCRTEPVRRVH